MGGGEMPLPKVPDYKTYSKIDGLPELEKLQRMLAAKGLKDPWIRNSVWAYQGKKDRGPPVRHLWAFLGRGFKVGLALAIVTSYFDLQYTKDWHSHHGEGHH